jgi:beta-glucosidase
MTDLALATSELSAGEPLDLQVRISNIGERAGAEVVQVYVSYPAELGEPPKQLRAFHKVALQPGSSEAVNLTLDARALAIWDSATHNWAVKPGTYKILVGDSSANTPLEATVTVR